MMSVAQHLLGCNMSVQILEKMAGRILMIREDEIAELLTDKKLQEDRKPFEGYQLLLSNI